MAAYLEIGLMLLAAVAGLTIWWLARSEPVWRWASLGMLFWGLQIGIRLLERQAEPQAPLTPWHALLVIAALAWAATLCQLPPREAPRLTLVLLPFVTLAPFISLLVFPAQLSQMVWLADLLPLLLALPLLEAALRGQASESRLVWGLGLLLKAGGSWALGLGWPPHGFAYLAWALESTNHLTQIRPCDYV